MKYIGFLVHPFATPGGYYIYDVNKNTILKVTKKTYELINLIMKENIDIENEHRFSDKEEINLIERMMDYGYLSSNTVNQVVHPIDEVLVYHLKNRVEKITLQVTQQCNLRCSYCIYSGSYHNRNHSNKRMTFDIAKKGIDFLIEHSKDCRKINVGFYGGEPLLEFELLKRCIEYAEERAEGKEITFNLTTNGTLINDEVIEYFERHDVSVMISLDGPKEIHDKSRRFSSNNHGTYDQVVKNLENIKEKFPEYFKTIMFSVVINPENNFSCINSFFIDYELLKESLLTPTIITDKYSRKGVSINEEFQIKRNYEYFKVLLNKLNRLDKKFVSRIVMQEYENLKRTGEHLRPLYKIPEKFHHSGPCIPGAQRLFMDVDGNFFPCERVSESSEIMNIGSVDEGFQVEKIRKLLNVGTLTESKCKSCWAFLHCFQCAAFADELTDLTSEKKATSCSFVKFTVESTFKDYCTLIELGHDFNCNNIIYL